MLSAVTLRRLSFVQLIILLLACAPLAGLAASHEPLFPRLESGVGTLRIGDRSFPLEYSKTAAGVLVALEPFVNHLGGALEVGPMREFHRLELGGAAFLFGPDSLTLTSGEEIIDLSQPPMAGGLGLHVPLDLLKETYGRQLAYELRWDERSRTLTVLRQQAREITVSLDTVQVQGVTTLVFEFGQQPRYRIRRVAGGVEVEMIGDTLRSLTRRPFTPDPLVRAVRMAGPSIAIQLAPQAVAEDYVLDSPFRLVFDVHRSETPPPPPASPALTPADRLPRREGEIETIVIDPGHGGADTGAQGSGGSQEKNLTLIVARQLKRRLEARLPVRVVLTRDQDEELPLDSRSSIANQHKASLFVSIHLNSTPRGDAQGAETYFLSLEASDELAAAAASAENSAFERSASDSESDPLHDLQLILWDLAQTHHLAESQRLAGIIQEELNLTLSLRNRGVKQAPFRVLMGAAMPAVLVELGFLTDTQEEQRLNDPDYRSQLADTLVRAIVRYRATTDTTEAPAASEALP